MAQEKNLMWIEFFKTQRTGVSFFAKIDEHEYNERIKDGGRAQVECMVKGIYVESLDGHPTLNITPISQGGLDVRENYINFSNFDVIRKVESSDITRKLDSFKFTW